MVNFTPIENFSMRRILLFFSLILIVVACKDVFTSPPKAFLNATLRYTDRAKDTALIDNIIVSVVGVDRFDPWIWNDTLIRSESSAKRTVLIPLNDTQNTDYIFVLNNLWDTIRIVADSKLIYESMETGFYPEFKIRSIEHTKHRIDYIEVEDSAVTKEWNENIIININTVAITNN